MLCFSFCFLGTSCSNLTQDASYGETDVDCGGLECPSCDLNKSCKLSTDCLSLKCDPRSLLCVFNNPTEENTATSSALNALNPVRSGFSSEGQTLKGYFDKFDLVGTLCMLVVFSSPIFFSLFLTLNNIGVPNLEDAYVASDEEDESATLFSVAAATNTDLSRQTTPSSSRLRRER